MFLSENKIYGYLELVEIEWWMATKVFTQEKICDLIQIGRNNELSKSLGKQTRLD